MALAQSLLFRSTPLCSRGSSWSTHEPLRTCYAVPLAFDGSIESRFRTLLVTSNLMSAGGASALCSLAAH
jgi:hypothetical protein